MAAVAESAFVEPARARRVLAFVETIALASLLGLGFRQLAVAIDGTYEMWRSDMGVYLSRGGPMFRSLSLGPSLAGLAFSLATIFVLARGHGRRRYFRAIAGGIGVLILGQLAQELAHREVPPVLDAIGIATVVVAAAWVALGRTSQTRTPLRTVAAAIVVVVAIVTSFPLISIRWRDLTQHHPPFTIEMYAAYDIRGAYIIVNDPHPEIVEIKGVRYEIDHSDGLRFDADDIGAIERDGDGIVLHITSTAKARALAKRSLRRISQLDALYVNGRRVAIPLYNDVLLGGSVQFTLRGDADADAVWTALGAP